MNGPDDMGAPEWDDHESDRERADRYLGQIARLRSEVAALKCVQPTLDHARRRAERAEDDVRSLGMELARYRAEAGVVDAGMIREVYCTPSCPKCQGPVDVGIRGVLAKCVACGETCRRSAVLPGNVDILALADAYEAKCGEVVRLSAQLAEARGLRLGRVLTVTDVERHELESGRWILISGADAEGAESADIESLFVKGGVIRSVAQWGPLPMDVSVYHAAIPLDRNGQPCPVGGWGGDS